ncbi:hypothetical protein SISSUDRAFT_108490 [Sistotremastrum suecicum HHB10207 ss-3]|uniref:MYND-type domain-containing protein n=1 Tax=Sistotremastrum suecicum HHB10207 ss-3 TaxID=1314776 RepID=A0A166GY95_9AGAM|nr:hypothetical protein SISSUDRAFT_108490 [Sistotremastrum suecicum HHB10207 ss-3]
MPLRISRSSMHANPVTPTMSSEGIMALMQANTRAVEFSNRAFQAVRLGDHQTALSLHRQALALKLRAYPETSVQAALTFNGLGESLIALGEFLAAEEVLSKALRVYDYEEYGGLGQGTRFDAAVARENMAQVREAQGRFADAVELRKRGKTRGQICCPNMQARCAPAGRTFLLSDLKSCSGCSNVFYCSAVCQNMDWPRHKGPCRAKIRRREAQQSQIHSDHLHIPPDEGRVLEGPASISLVLD